MASSVVMSTDFGQSADQFKVPYEEQDPQEVTKIVKDLDAHATKGGKSRAKYSCRKTSYEVETSPTGIEIFSWKFQDQDYKRRDLPTYARGFFTTRKSDGSHEIVIRGYDKFFNNDEVNETKWDNILSRTRGPYELSLKENGCIIFISGLEDDTLLVCSKHSTGSRGASSAPTHANVGEQWLEKQLNALGKTKADLARDLRARNATAVAELCDDSFEEHILAYTGDLAGLYLHGINLNTPKFHTYPSPLVQNFATNWGFKKTGLIMMDDIKKVKDFLEECAETGAHEGRDVEGFVIRCQETYDPNRAAFHDWFFKYKFDEPYLMYRQWRECTKALIAGRNQRYKKHRKITEEYLNYAKKRLAKNPKLSKDYMQNHGIISLRNEFLAYKQMDGADAAKMEELLDNSPDVNNEVSKDVIIAPIATIGCGKTTVALALCSLFGWGHVQNDNITGKVRPPRFVRACINELTNGPAVFADRNNAQKHERKQLIKDCKDLNRNATVVALHFVHTEEKVEEVRRICRERVIARGDNHQTIQAATDQQKFIDVMDGFITRFEPVDPFNPPDSYFDSIIDLDPTAGSRANLDTVIKELHTRYPMLLPKMPNPVEMDVAIQEALDYKPELRHNIKSHTQRPRDKLPERGPQQPRKPRPVEFFAVGVPASDINSALEKAFKEIPTHQSRLYTQLKGTRRVQPQFHVTLMHRATSQQNPQLWDKYISLQKAEAEKTGRPDAQLGECDVLLERVVYDDRIMAIVVRLADADGTWQTTNKVAHITVGTRDDSVKPKESNDLLAAWLENGVGGNIHEVVFENKLQLKGNVHAVLSRGKEQYRP
ncbi:hypothetical protein MKZ38_000259 [Zalerion maritima]|uniref:tRNA ligase n=1 Tax=Zalerion maritima TaxID=339359 RepID=A0AAD5RTC9_9PEZI|nr:hypothetical protein MKZ38_000259 [Zalerion maritima]